jgi:hypothetical protein
MSQPSVLCRAATTFEARECQGPTMVDPQRKKSGTGRARGLLAGPARISVTGNWMVELIAAVLRRPPSLPRLHDAL